MASKPKTPQKENLSKVSGRDLFQTPNYAVDILVPYLLAKKFFGAGFRIWECAAGLGKIVRRLKEKGLDVYGSDLDSAEFPKHNFLTQSNGQEFDCIVTNPPFSLKRKFYEMCMRYEVPFALLIPADYSTWIIDAVKMGAEKIIPTRRIDYITPNILKRIHEGEIWETLRQKFPAGAVNDFKKNKLEEFKKEFPITWQQYLVDYEDFCNWSSVYDVPSLFLKKYSSSYYHSMWLTRGFGLGKTETFVDLSNEEKAMNI